MERALTVIGNLYRKFQALDVAPRPLGVLPTTPIPPPTFPALNILLISLPLENTMEAPQESDAQRRARERRERRQAKIASQGASRLEAITSLSGRPAPAVENGRTSTS